MRKLALLFALLASTACGVMPEYDNCPNGVQYLGPTPDSKVTWEHPETKAALDHVIATAEVKWGKFDGFVRIYQGPDQVIQCGPPCSDGTFQCYSGCSQATTCDADISIRFIYVPYTTDSGHLIYSPTVCRSSLGHELCHSLAGIVDQTAANECGAALYAETCATYHDEDCP